jgi:radical SAM protein with 4Fe4S-binding SPASM domain
LSDLDDTRLTLAGVGDPLLAPQMFEIIRAARGRGLWIHVETDLLGASPETIRELATSEVDVVSVHLPAMTEETYQAVMDISAYREVLENIRLFVTERAARGSAMPLIVPLFTKCKENLAEMEPWYDQWLRAVGSAVIVGPSDFGGLSPDVSVADMAPPRRRACARLASRITVLSDGRIVSCEQDVTGQHVLGQIGKDRVADVWNDRFADLRAKHREGQWAGLTPCGGCREWHRP